MKIISGGFLLYKDLPHPSNRRSAKLKEGSEVITFKFMLCPPARGGLYANLCVTINLTLRSLPTLLLNRKSKLPNSLTWLIIMSMGIRN